MLRKIGNLIFNNFGLKILAVVIALVAWMIILNIEDPDKTKVFTVEVEIENEEYLTEMGKTYEVLNNSDTISFTATGRRSIIESLEASDFNVTADLEDIVNMSQVPITISAKRYSGSLDISNKTQYVEVNVENLVTETFEITAQTSGEMKSDYSICSMTVSPENVTIEGPESVVEQIDSVVVLVDVSSKEEDFEQEAEILIYDEDGDEVSKDRLTLSQNTAAVAVSVLQTKTVSLTVETSGTPPDGSRVMAVSADRETLQIQGKKSDLSDISSITINGDALDVSDLTETTEITVDLSEYLPSGAAVASGESASVTVTVEIESTVEESFEISPENITVENLEDGLTCEITSETVTVTLVGYESELSDVDASDLTGSVDASGLEAGSHTVSVDLDGEYETDGSVWAVLTITEEESEE